MTLRCGLAMMLSVALTAAGVASCEEDDAGTPGPPAHQGGSGAAGAGGHGGGGPNGGAAGQGGLAGGGGSAGSGGSGASCPDMPERLRFGMNIDPANPGGNPSAADLRSAGARWARVEWKVNQDPAQDATISALRTGGIRVLLIIDYSSVPSKPASNASDGEWLAYLPGFAAKAGELAAHYGDGIDAWQIWNEPDLNDPGSGYDPGVPAAHYGVMLRDAVDAIRTHSTRPIVTGGLASGNPAYLADARDAVGSLDSDAVAVHPYGQRAPDDWPTPNWGFGNMSDLFDGYLAFGQPLWVSEIGTIDEPHLADYLENVYELAAGQYADSVAVVFWFCWSDAMVPPYGLHLADGTPKPAFDRYQSIAPPWDDSCDGIGQSLLANR